MNYGEWAEWPDGSRVYTYEVIGRAGWRAKYNKQVDAKERVLRFWQEVFDPKGRRVEIHDNPIEVPQ